jgi:hypothetical protein
MTGRFIVTAIQAPDGEPHGHPLGEAFAVEQTITTALPRPSTRGRKAG